MANSIVHIKGGELHSVRPNDQERNFLDRANRGEFSRSHSGVDLRGKVSNAVFSYIDGDKNLHWVDVEGMNQLIDAIKRNRGVFTRSLKSEIESRANRRSSHISNPVFF